MLKRTSDNYLEIIINCNQEFSMGEFGSDSGADETIYVFSEKISIEEVVLKIKNVGATATNRHVVLDNFKWS